MQLAGNRSFYLMANWKPTACKWRYNDFYLQTYCGRYIYVC